MGQTNKKIIQTRQSLRTAIIVLSQKKNLKDITVTELCREAAINRTTFYKYYSVPSDVLAEYIEEILMETTEQIQYSNEFSEDSIYKVILWQCQAFYKNREIIKMYFAFTQDIVSIIQKFFGGAIESALDEMQCRITFISGGVASLLVRWVLAGYPQSPETMAHLLTKYILRVEL